MKPHSVGSIWPSSKHLSKAMLEEIDFHPGDVVVEYGPGTGSFTHLLQDHLPKGIHYLGIEYDLNLCKALHRRFPDMLFHHGSAEETPTLLKKYGLGAACLIISGLPFANMPASLQENILTATEQSLRPNGLFRTFTYLCSGVSPRARHFQKRVALHFQEEEKQRIVLRNVPPARVLSYKKREDL